MRHTRLGASAAVRRPDGSPVATEDFVALIVRVAQLEARQAALEGTRGPRDAADSALIRVVFSGDIGSTPFRPSDLLRFSRLDRGTDVRHALLAADIVNPRELGQLLLRLSKADSVDGLRVRKQRRRRHWVVVPAVVRDITDSR